MGILNYFSSEMNKSLYILNKTTQISSVDYTVSEEFDTDNKAIKACLYSKFIAEKYFGVGMWKADTQYVAVINSGSGIELSDHVRIDDIEYCVDSIDDVAFQGELILVGLRGVE